MLYAHTGTARPMRVMLFGARVSGSHSTSAAASGDKTWTYMSDLDLSSLTKI
jgi:hypothetical protein